MELLLRAESWKERVMMKFYVLNGSPRKNHNTAKILECAVEGIKSVLPDAQINWIHVYDLSYSGCVSCYGCKRVNGRSYGKCAKRDSISGLLEDISEGDGLLIGSPVFFHGIPGQMRAFLERLLYPYLVYGKEYTSIAPKRFPAAFLYTMNATEEKMKQMNYPIKLSAMEEYTGVVFSKPEIFHCFDTCQFDDYALYKAERFSQEEKLKVKKEQFPKDCQRAAELGKKIAQKAICQNPTASESPGRI